MDRQDLMAASRALALATGVMLAAPASAADTVETWARGATDLDFYMGYDGIGAAGDAQALFGDIMLGYGVVEGLSAYLGATLHSDGALGNGSSDLYLGVFGTPVETDHFDVDLFLEMAAGGPGHSVFQLAPAVELNADLAPDQRVAGLYLRAGLPMYGQSRSVDSGQHETAVAIELNPGAYVTLAEDHQLLLEGEVVLHPRPPEGDHRVEIGGVALGYNASLGDVVELITQAYLDVPTHDGEPFAVGLMAGFIATLPSGAAPPASPEPAVACRRP